MIGSRSLYTLTLTAALTLAASSARATTLPDNASITPTSILLSDHPEFAGTTIFTNDSGYYSVVPPTSSKEQPHAEAGVLHTQVVRENATGTLDYYYSVTSTTGFGVYHLDFSGVPVSESLDAYVIQNPGAASYTSLVGRSSYQGISNIFSSPSLLLRTNDTAFGGAPTGSMQLLFGTDLPGNGSAISIVIPGGPATGPIPEPASLTLLPLALTALSLRLRRH